MDDNFNSKFSRHFPKGSKRFQTFPKINKQTQFKSSGNLIKSETNCNDVFLKIKINYINATDTEIWANYDQFCSLEFMKRISRQKI